MSHLFEPRPSVPALARHASLNRRRFLGAAGAAGLSAAALSACAGPETGEGGGDDTEPTDIDYSSVKPAETIEYWSIHPGSSHDTEVEIVEAYNASQSDTLVKLVTAGGSYDEIAQKFQIAQQSRQLPGVILIDKYFSFYLNDAILPLENLIKAVDLDVDDYVPSFWNEYNYDDQQLMVPYAKSTAIFYYNKTHFDKAGLPSRGPETWDEVAEWGQKLMKADLGIKAGFEFDNCWNVQGLIWAFGGGYSDKFDVTMTSPGTTDAFEWCHKAVFADKWGVNAEQSDASAFDLRAGAVSMIVETTGFLGQILDSAKGKFELGTAFLPAGPKASDFVCPTGGAALAIPSRIDPGAQLAGMNFLKFATSPEISAKFAAATGYMPVRTSSDMSAIIAERPQAKTAYEQLPHAKGQDYAAWIFPGGNRILQDALDESLTKADADIPAVLQTTQDKLTDVYETDIKPALEEKEKTT